MGKLIRHKMETHLNVCGVDESGCGSWAGSVFAAALILPNDYHHKFLDDSKKMTPKKRGIVYEDIINNAISYSISSVNNNEIDEINILEARFKAMDKAIKSLHIGSDYLLIDGDKFIKDYSIPYECIIRGDGQYYNIAGASVLAKVSKDNEMLELHEEYNMYSWDTNKSYGTKQHLEAIREHGFSKYHRKSYNIKL